MFPISVLRAFKELLSNKDLRGLYVTPLIIGVVIYATSFYLGYLWLTGLSGTLLQMMSVYVQIPPEIYNAIATTVVVILSIATASVVSLIGVNILGLLFIEKLLIKLMAKRGWLSESTETNMLSAMRRGVIDETFKMLLLIAISIILLPLGFIPVLGFIAFVLGFFLIGYELIDLPLMLLGYRFRERWKMNCQQFVPVTAIGFWYSWLLFIPFTGVIFLPPFYVATLDVISKMRGVAAGGGASQL